MANLKTAGMAELLAQLVAASAPATPAGGPRPASTCRPVVRPRPRSSPDRPTPDPATRRPGPSWRNAASLRWPTCNRALAAAERPRRSTRRAADARAPRRCWPPLYDQDGRAVVVLTRRSSTLRSHRGEVGFPGEA